jgi:hypothetical protein
MSNRVLSIVILLLFGILIWHMHSSTRRMERRLDYLNSKEIGK